MFSPSLAFLKQVVDPSISGFTSRIIKTSASPSTTYRVALEYPEGHLGVLSVIVKSIAPIWPRDPDGPDREPKFYAHLLPQLDLKHVELYHVGIDPETQCRLIVMEDLAPGYRFSEPTHLWTCDEACCMVRTYAHLHVQGGHCLPPEGERSWMWRMALHERPWEAEEILRLIDDLVKGGVWSPLLRIERLVEQTLADMVHFARLPVTLLHNDVFPPNVALPLELNDEAILLDWEMVGWGLAELDLAFMFLQPFRGTRNIDRARVLDHYWAERQVLEGVQPPAGERRAVQLHADALWALSLVPVAHSVVAKPYPPGSAPKAYWDSMLSVLHERLAELCGAI
jgi:hypothetical protein